VAGVGAGDIGFGLSCMGVKIPVGPRGDLSPPLTHIPPQRPCVLDARLFAVDHSDGVVLVCLPLPCPHHRDSPVSEAAFVCSER
jgi:hypothetical protein